MPPPTVHLTCFCFSPFFVFLFFQELRHAVLRAQRVSSEARDEAAAVKMEQEEQVRKEKKRKHIYILILRSLAAYRWTVQESQVV